ncbi:conserved hypothetical protein [Theileria equi strain WA]|uniref:Uncharacterized protein n=1 Tax=Theileria equi strain WA TaxID=1537102 RepID=L1LCE8_THEEQ|nr:conserved hypothetical protein [Theileria equi strain WA]EKX73117.1 conserved hypothetical protein [Theileria equi strain WA]|eukprot:XP_004832569.1 conserved hypothetical protein [Theileria equi strain WA]
MNKQQFIPVNLYFHTNKQEWRARYIDNGVKKAKHFSCKRYNYKRAYLLGTVFMRYLHNEADLPSNEFLTLWLSVVQNFKSLEENYKPKEPVNKECRFSSRIRRTTQTENVQVENLNEVLDYLHVDNREFMNKVIDDVEFKTFISKPSSPSIPDIHIGGLRNDAEQLYQALSKYKARPNVPSDNPLRVKEIKVEPSKNSLHNTFMRIFGKISNSITISKNVKLEESDPKDSSREGTSKPSDDKAPDESHDRKSNYANFDLKSQVSLLKRINNTLLKDVHPLLVKQLESGNTMHESFDIFSSDPLNTLLDTLESIIDHNKRIIKKMCPDMDSEVEQFCHPPSLKYPLDTFSQDLICDVRMSNILEEPIINMQNPRNSLYDQANSGYLPKPSNHSAIIKEEDNEKMDDKNLKQSMEYRKICNEKLRSLIEQTEDLDSDDFYTVVSKCIDDESKAMSDLESLIKISNRTGNKLQDEHSLLFGTKLYDVDGEYRNKHIQVSYVNGKIIPSSAMHLQHEFSRKDTGIVLRGRDKIDVYFDVLLKNLTKYKNQGSYILQILGTMSFIDKKINSIVAQYEKMHRALYRYHSEHKDADSTHALEELLNLEVLHIVCETLIETKMKFINQIYGNVNAQLGILHSIMPAKYYDAFTRILYGIK